MFCIESEIPLAAAQPTRFHGLAYDGCRFYLTDACTPRIVAYDSCFREEDCFETCRCYTSLCYDPCANCFWAACRQCPATLFRLDDCFRELGALRVGGEDLCVGVITGVSYSCGDKALLLSCAAGILRVDWRKPRKAQVLTGGKQAWMQGVCAVSPYYICFGVRGESRFLQVYSANGTLLEENEIPGGCDLETVLFYPCTKEFCTCHFYMLVTRQNCYPAVLKCVWESGGRCGRVDPCNYEICKRACHEDHRRRNGCNAVLESVALVEAAIAHILNAEGEKLQKVLASTDDVCEILKANASVQKTMEKATCLEHLLCNKLEFLSECCPPREEDCPKPYEEC